MTPSNNRRSQPHAELPQTHPQAPDDAELVLRAKCGEQDAFGELFLRYRERVFGYLFSRLGGDASEAADLTSEVFTKAFAFLPNFELRGAPFLGWLYRIAHNILVDHWRRASRLRFSVLDERAALPESGGPSPERVQNLVVLEQAFNQLTPDQRRVLSLRIVEDCTAVETARRLRKTPDAVKQLQRRALATMRRTLEGAPPAA